VGELTPEIARQLNVPNGVRGVVVTNVDGTSTSGLQTGDVIEEINQQPVTSVAGFKKMAGSLDPNGTQVLSVCRRRTRSFVVLRPG
jgi:serine protease Do